jgi:hypothetical protein
MRNRYPVPCVTKDYVTGIKVLRGIVLTGSPSQ